MPRRNYLIDVRRFCRSLPVRCQNADERISVAPGQKTAAFSSHFVFGCLSQKPAHIGLKVIKDGSCRRGQQSPICEDSLPPSVRLNSSKARVADCRGQIRDPGGALGLTYHRRLSMRSRLSKRRGCAVCPRVATTRRPLIPLPQRPARGYETPLVTGSDAGQNTGCLSCVRDEGRALRLISSHLGTRSRSGGMAEVLKGARERGNECAA